MPTYKYEALDTSGAEVKDSVEASNEEEAQQKVKAMGYFVTKLTAMGGGKGQKAKKKKTGRSRKTFVIGGVKQKMLVTFTRQFSTLQDAGLPVLRSLRILERQMKPSALKNALTWSYRSSPARISSTSTWSMQFTLSGRRSGSRPSSNCTSI